MIARVARAYMSARKKLVIVLEAETSPVKAVARKHSVQPLQIRRWAKNQAQLEATVSRNPRATTLNGGRPRQDAELEDKLAAWIIERRSYENSSVDRSGNS
ncbi:hypothetical protein V7S43_001978 [Phytophthora oleae]|uniref:HTH psq-type domain-containing protein n=1 Tax=Phytophthora oleae TaxID=2107226 RepID=A0ABD3G4B8_9STRA